MNDYVTGSTVKELREKKKLTQRQLADILCVSDKTVSKWETGRGLPDISILESLASALSVSVAELLSGDCVKNENRSGNLGKSKFYVCPVCGNVIWATGEGAFSCCGINLPPLEAEETDNDHEINFQNSDGQWYVTMNHPMEKSHYISFLALVTTDRTQIIKLYPEQNAQANFSICGQGYLYAFCNRHGLFRIKI